MQSKNEFGTLSTLFVVDLLQGVCCNIELQANSFCTVNNLKMFCCLEVFRGLAVQTSKSTQTTACVPH